jgi:hypothetical protein
MSDNIEIIETTEIYKYWRDLVLDKLKKETDYEEVFKCKLNIIILLLVLASRGVQNPHDYLYQAAVFLLDQKIEVLDNFILIENIDQRFNNFIYKGIRLCNLLVKEENRPKQTRFSSNKVNWIN